MISPKNSQEVEQLLARWAATDDAAGNQAVKRRRATLAARGEKLQEYAFREKPNDWVHRDWMRPIRFVYRNIPTVVRMQLKKRLVK